MRTTGPLITAAFATLAACEASTDPSDIAARLKVGDTAVCAEREVEETFVAVLVGEETYRKFLANGHKLPPLKVVNATGVNKDIGEVSCSGNFEFPEPFFGSKGGRVDFKVRPALDEGGGFVVEAGRDDAANGAVASWVTLNAMKEEQSTQEQTDPSADMSAVEMNATETTDGSVPTTDEEFGQNDLDENVPDMNATEGY